MKCFFNSFLMTYSSKPEFMLPGFFFFFKDVRGDIEILAFIISFIIVIFTK